MNNQTIEQQRELRRFEDRKGKLCRPMPWYLRSDAKQAVASVLIYLALALVIVVGVPIALNRVFNWINTIKVFL